MPLAEPKQPLAIAFRSLSLSLVYLILCNRQECDEDLQSKLGFDDGLEDQDSLVLDALAIINEPTVHRWWIQMRSQHWIQNILSEELLIGYREFENNFRMRFF
jgi:hypothetical protein